MKKNLFSAVALLTLLFAASCQKENFSGADGEFATVTLTVQAPASPSTKALGDGTKAKNLVFGVFDETGAELTDLRQGDWMNANQTEITFDDKLQAKVTVNLAKGKTYTFVCWAQTKEYGDPKTPVTCYDFKNLDDITVDYTVNNEANNEHRDAFYACVTSGIVKKDYETTITLTRPFGQLNIGTDDMAAAQSAGLDLANLWVELSVTNCPTHLVADMDQHNYTVDGLTTAKFTKALCPASLDATETLDVDVNSDKTIADSEKYGWLAMNYIFTDHQDVKDDTPKNIAFDLYEGDLSLVKYKRDNVPFRANYRTNLLGRLLTADGDITVIIDPVPAGDENVGGIEDISVVTIEELNAVTASGTYNVGGTITADGVESATNGAGYEDVEINDGKNTATYTLKIPATKAEGEYEAYYKAGGYLIVAVDVKVDDNGEIQRTSRDTHVAYVPNTEDEEEAPVEPKLSLELATDGPVSAGGGSLSVKVTSNVAWTLALDGKTVMEGKEAVTDQVVEVIVPENEGSEVTHTLLLSNVPAEGAEAVTATATFTQAAAQAVTPEVTKLTVAEFLAAAEGDTMYELTGVITRVANTTYGNFDLTDATGTVYIYGLCSPEGAKQYWADSGAKVGDTITVQTIRTSYNGSPQGKDALFVSLVPFVAEASEWGVVGDLTGWTDGSDIVMYNTWKAENLFVAYNVEIASGSFKIRANNEWNDAKNYGLAAAGKIYADKYYALTNGSSSQNATPMAYGTYDVYLDLTNERVALVTPGKEYADAVDGGDPVVVIEGLTDHEWGLVGAFNGWDVENYVEATIEGDWAVVRNVTLENGATFKFAADKAWTLSYGAGCEVNVGETYTTYENGDNMKFVGEAGAYNFYFSMLDAKFYMETYSEVKEFTATITFDSLDKRTSKTDEQAVWEENGITVTNDKAESVTSIADYCKPARFYQNSNLTVAVGGRITSIEFDCNSNSYATVLAETLGVTTDSDKVTVTLDTPSASFVVENLGKQVRMDAITVTYNK